MYLTYEEYLACGGSLGETDFEAAEFRARKRIDRLTDGRVRAMAERGSDDPGEGAVIPEAVKRAMMTIIRADAAVGVDAQAGAPPVAAFNTDGYSERYSDPQARTAALERQLNGELARLLCGETDDEGTELLYRGIV